MRFQHQAMPWRCAILAATLAFAGCSSSLAKRPPTASAPAGARAAVFQLMFTSNGSAIQGGAAAFCVGDGVGWKLRDPAQSVLQALRGDARVKPASACDMGKDGARVVDRASGKPALLFGLDLIDCVSESDCRFRGSYYEGNLSAQGNVYRARLVDGVWRAVMESRGPAS